MLTAQEISMLDLASAEWVVLSACETGLGRPQAGEGLLGLRRAFQLAGARSVITSLWEVRDDSTRRWMATAYEARLGGASTADSVRRAELELLREARRTGADTHPFHWGAFVATGDWR